MIVKGREIEILAPAGNFDNLKTAVDSGADSVYFGLSSFNARRNADNFSTFDDAKRAVDYCHLRGARAHVTINTIVYDEEFSELEKTVRIANSAGFDAVIVQDLGAVSLIKQMTDIPLHASTQMSAHSASDAMKLKEMGFKRVVLAREMSLDEIRKVVESVDIETEIFVHGALCMSVSGQCYFSSALGERSGNRGLCAGVCRLPFHVNEKGRYALSLKDQSVIDYIETFAETGITSLKIEGRMKSSAYVKTIVEQTRKMAETSSYDRKLLESAFSRQGFTDGYITGKRDNMFGVRSEKDKEKTRQAEKALAGKNPEGIKHSIYLSCTAREEKPFTVTAYDEERSVTVFSDTVQKARKKAVNVEDIKKNLSKFGNTVYEPEEIHVDLDEGIFIPVSVINGARRELCEKLDEKRLEGFRRKEASAFHKKHEGIHENVRKDTGMFYDIRVLDEEIMNLFDTVFVPLFDLEKAAEKTGEKNLEKLGVMIPRVWFEDDRILENHLEKAKKLGISKAMAHTLGRCQMADSLGFEVYTGFGMNTANSEAVSVIEKEIKGLKDITLSFENTFNRMNRIESETALSAIVYGRLPLMITRNCPVKEEISCRKCRRSSSLTDRMNEKFPVRCASGTSEIYNAHPLCVFERDDRLSDRINRILLFATEGKREIRNVMKAYSERENIPESTRGCYFRKLT